MDEWLAQDYTVLNVLLLELLAVNCSWLINQLVDIVFEGFIVCIGEVQGISDEVEHFILPFRRLFLQYINEHARK